MAVRLKRIGLGRLITTTAGFARRLLAVNTSTHPNKTLETDQFGPATEGTIGSSRILFSYRSDITQMQHRHLSKAAVTRLRHGDNSQFLHGVGMDMGSFVDFMTRKCKWDDHTNAYQNEGRYRAEQFDTDDYACQWDMKGIVHMLGRCSNHQRFSLMKVRK